MKLTLEQKAANKASRAAARQDAKRAARIELEKNQKPVESITISITWHKSRMWGNCPNAEAVVIFKDGTGERRDGFRASGCGYDKESTVIAEVFNTFLRYKLHAIADITGGHGSNDSGPAPYGINRYVDSRSFAGGIGTSCYMSISKFIGGNFEHVASGKMFDVFKYTDGVKV